MCDLFSELLASGGENAILFKVVAYFGASGEERRQVSYTTISLVSNSASEKPSAYLGMRCAWIAKDVYKPAAPFRVTLELCDVWVGECGSVVMDEQKS